MGGLMSAQTYPSWLARFPRLILYALISAGLISILLKYSDNVAQVDFGRVTDAQALFFGTERSRFDLAKFFIPLEAVLAVFTAMLAVLSFGFGQYLTRLLIRAPNKLKIYSMNVLGSFAGILSFGLLSYFHTSPELWFLLVFCGTIFLLGSAGELRKQHYFLSFLSVLFVAVISHSWTDDVRSYWSPYYRIDHVLYNGAINVDNIGHQVMAPLEQAGPGYGVVYQLRSRTDQPSFRRALIIGAGSGNDVAAAVAQGVQHVDAVEIDPVILSIGVSHHPDRPYSDQRVHRINEDGRTVLSQARGGEYDLIVYALVDSLLSTSSFSGVRLESYLFTTEAFAQVRRVLASDGVFVAYNLFRQGWLVHRLADMLERAFGERPLVLSVPNMKRIGPDEELHYLTILVAGNTKAFQEYFRDVGSLTLSTAALNNRAESVHLSPVDLSPPVVLAPATDDWPHLYLKSPGLPLRPYLSMIAALLATFFILYQTFLRQSQSPLRDSGIRMFFLGAGFMLMETRAVIQLQLIFGNTWIVTSLVFASILGLVFLSNLFVMRFSALQAGSFYFPLVVSLIVLYLFPFDWFNSSDGTAYRPLAFPIALLPVPFGTAIFLKILESTPLIERDLAANFLGCCTGAVIEMISLLFGIKSLVIIAGACYVLAMFQYGSKPQKFANQPL